MRRSLPLALAVLAATAVAIAPSCTSNPPVNTCTGDGSCDGGRCVVGSCYAKACGQTQCALAQVCSGGACTDELCVGKSCEAGSTCLKGQCLKTSCGAMPCGANQVCDEAKNQCVDAACYGVLCPTGQACSGGTCRGGQACGTMTCGVGQTCVADVCRSVCGASVCAATEVCDQQRCSEPACVGVRCDGGTCAGGACSADAGVPCGSTTCTGARVCDMGSCVEPACSGVRCDGGSCVGGSCLDVMCQGVTCDGGVCRLGQCYDACQLSCASPCPACMNGRTCAGPLECESRRCLNSVCTACSVPADCPNGGACQGGICRSGLLGPCASTLDCRPGAPTLTCDRGLCRVGQNASCSSDTECIGSLRCENLVCQRPRCLLQLLERQVLPGVGGAQSAQAFGLTPAGEIYVTLGFTGNDVRRYRVSPGGDAGIVEQQPTMAPLLMTPTNILVQGHADTAGTGTVTGNTGARTFYWMPGGGAFDGRVAVQVQFTGFNQDAFPNLTNLGRFAKCGNHFYFAMQSSMTPSGRVLLRFTTPNAVGSGTMEQVLSASDARRDDNVFTYFNDVACTASTLYVLGVQNNTVMLQRLNPLTLANVGPALPLPQIAAESSTGDVMLGVVDDTYLYLLGIRGEAFQVWDGGATSLGDMNFGTITNNVVQANANAQGPVIQTYDGHIWRYARRMMNGSEPPPDLDCQWQ